MSLEPPQNSVEMSKGKKINFGWPTPLRYYQKTFYCYELNTMPKTAQGVDSNNVAYGYSYKPRKAVSPAARPRWSSWFWQRCHSRKSLCSTGPELIKTEEIGGGKEKGEERRKKHGDRHREREREREGRKRGLAEANSLPPQLESSAATAETLQDDSSKGNAGPQT